MDPDRAKSIVDQREKAEPASPSVGNDVAIESFAHRLQAGDGQRLRRGWGNHRGGRGRKPSACQCTLAAKGCLVQSQVHP